jgi:transglutaminase-like putative cysteine protease
MAVEKLNREIRYTGIEFAEASVVPRTPAEVLKRKFGDCKDKAALAVALLRAAGIEAHVALLLSSFAKTSTPNCQGWISSTTPLFTRLARRTTGWISRIPMFVRE